MRSVINFEFRGRYEILRERERERGATNTGSCVTSPTVTRGGCPYRVSRGSTTLTGTTKSQLTERPLTGIIFFYGVGSSMEKGSLSGVGYRPITRTPSQLVGEGSSLLNSSRWVDVLTEYPFRLRRQCRRKVK